MNTDLLVVEEIIRSLTVNGIRIMQTCGRRYIRDIRKGLR